MQRQAIGGDCCAAGNGRGHPGPAVIQHGVEQTQQGQHAGEAQAPLSRHMISQQNACDRRNLPSRPVDGHAAPEIRLLLRAWRQVRKAPQESHIVQISGEVAHQNSSGSGQMTECNAPLHAENYKAQIDTKCRRPNHPQGRGTGDQRQRRQLRTAGKHEQTHQQGHGHAHAALDHRHAGYQPPSRNAQVDAQHFERGALEFRVAPLRSD